MMTEREGLQLFAVLAAAYPKEPMTDAQVSLYTQMLASYDGAQVRHAMLLHIQTNPWFPRLSDLIGRLTHRDQLDPDEAWAEVLHTVQTVGYYRVPAWSHPALADAVQALGWQTLCQSENPEADRAHFMKFYAVAVTRQREQTLGAQLAALDPRTQTMLAQIGQPLTVREVSRQ